VPGDLAAEITAELDIPTVGIGAGPGCDAQVLVWQDAMGLRQGRTARFVKQYAQMGQILEQAAATYVEEVASGAFPASEHTFADSPESAVAPAPAPTRAPAQDGTALASGPASDPAPAARA
jgi:3-methyl-2-oxobutanoate hydroxymethyltransferase